MSMGHGNPVGTNVSACRSPTVLSTFPPSTPITAGRKALFWDSHATVDDGFRYGGCSEAVMTKQEQRNARIRRELESLKAEVARQNREFADTVEEAGVTEADLANAETTFADAIEEIEPIRTQTFDLRLVPSGALRA